MDLLSSLVLFVSCFGLSSFCILYCALCILDLALWVVGCGLHTVNLGTVLLFVELQVVFGFSILHVVFCVSGCVLD